MSSTSETWGHSFDLIDLEAALAFAEDHNLPVHIEHAHEGAPEVIHVEGRYSARSNPYQFMVWRADALEGHFAVSEGEVEGCERRLYFADLTAALRFCKAQRGADWPDAAA